MDEAGGVGRTWAEYSSLDSDLRQWGASDLRQWGKAGQEA